MIDSGKATAITIHFPDRDANDEQRYLHFAASEGEYFIGWGITEGGLLTLRSHRTRTIFAAGEWQSISVDEYQLRPTLN